MRTQCTYHFMYRKIWRCRGFVFYGFETEERKTENCAYIKILMFTADFILLLLLLRYVIINIIYLLRIFFLFLLRFSDFSMIFACRYIRPFLFAILLLFYYRIWILFRNLFFFIFRMGFFSWSKFLVENLLDQMIWKNRRRQRNLFIFCCYCLF